MHRPRIALQCGDACCCGSIYAVVLAPAAFGELANTSSRRGRDIDHQLAESEQPQSEMMAESIRVFDRPLTGRPLVGPREHAPVVDDGGLDPDGPEVGVRGGRQPWRYGWTCADRCRSGSAE